MTPKERAIELLCQGVSTTQVAEAIGVDPSYISQLKADPDTAAKIAEATAKHTIDDVHHDSKMDKIEALALERIERTIGYANFGQALAAFKILNGATRRQEKSTPTPQQLTSVVVNLTLPAGALPNYILNNKNEIVEVEGKAMVSATAQSLDQILAAKAAARLPQIAQTTDIERAADRLDSLNMQLTVPRERAAPKSPLSLAADCL